MRLTITPLGATGSSSNSVSATIVDYLEGARRDPGVTLFCGSTAAAGAYYADSREGPGRWLGAGAAFQRLAGSVDRDAFQRVLDGRHPVTGARLVTAQGSSQRSHVATGTAARFDVNGEALYSLADAAQLLGMCHSDVAELVEAGQPGGLDVSKRTWLGTVETSAGSMVPDREISRHLEFAAAPVTAADVLSEGGADDLLSVADAARSLAVAARYVRRLCETYLNGAGDGGDRRGRAALVSRRIGHGRRARYVIRRGDLANFAAARKAPVARVGFDVTLTCEKSIGLLAVLAGAGRQPAIVNALSVANDTAIAHLDRLASVGRKHGVPVRTEGLVVASYLHGTSRALDPHPHHHNIVANAVVDADGDVRTLDARALYRHAPAAAALADAAVRWELRDLGLGWWRRDDGVWEVAGIDQAAIDEFSRRRNEIAEVKTALQECLGRDLSGHEDGTAAMATRQPKQAVDRLVLLEDWRRRADEVGLDVQVCFERDTDRALCYEVLPDRQAARLFADLTSPTEGLCATTTRFDRGDAMAMIADWSILDSGIRRKVLLPPGEVERLADRFCASEHVAELIGHRGTFHRADGTVISDGQQQPVYATVELLEAEAEILRRYRDGRGAAAGTVTDEHLQLLHGRFDGIVLTGEQQHLVEAWCTSGQRIQAAVGRAGTGKTTTMKAAAAVWAAAGYRVVGCAVKGEAARQLGEDAGIDSDTVALLLARADRGQVVVDARTVLIVDEASTIGDRDLLAICRLADNADATIRLIGDPAQHGSVPAGGAFAHLVADDAAQTPELTDVRRLRDVGERHRAELVRAGHVTQALKELETSGQLVLTDSDAETYATMLQRWYQHRHNGDRHPMVHGRNRQRRMLNQLAQTLLAADGHVDLNQAVIASDGRRLAVGDEIIARHGDRRIHPTDNPKAWMRNGTTGHIAAVHHATTPADDTISIHTPGGILTCPRAVFDRRRGGIDLGYAITSYAVQGSTRDASTSAITNTTTRSELYVDITRGRDSNQLYATRHTNQPDDRESEAHLPQIDTDLIPSLRQTLARSARRSALAIDPDALAANRNQRGRTLASLLAERRRNNDEALDAAITRATNSIRRQARSDPPASIRHTLPARPSCPHLAGRWDDLAGDIAVHLAASHDPRRRQPTTALEQTLGPPPNNHDRHTTWNHLADAVIELAVDITTWQLNRYADTGRHVDLDQWLPEHLRQLARHGQLANPNIETLHHLIVDIANYRARHPVPDHSTNPLGERPTERTQRAEHDQLAHRLGSPIRATQRSIT